MDPSISRYIGTAGAIMQCGTICLSSDSASGFCYVNDIVLAILTLLDTYKRVLYIDIDIHHGDGVEKAFAHSKSVFTFSFHKHQIGFFPGSGHSDSVGIGKGKHHLLNVGLDDGIGDVQFCSMFESVVGALLGSYRPDVIVVQCGADGLAGDRLGGWNLTTRGITLAISCVLKARIPIMLLGGGGYCNANAARCWASVTAAALDVTLPQDIPEHDYLCQYLPDFQLDTLPSGRWGDTLELGEKTAAALDHVNLLE